MEYSALTPPPKYQKYGRLIEQQKMQNPQRKQRLQS